jgi:hypothetical protein
MPTEHASIEGASGNCSSYLNVYNNGHGGSLKGMARDESSTAIYWN